MVQQQLHLSLWEIRENFSKSIVTATLQCAGNRRQDLMEVAPVPGEVPWSAGAIGNTQWGGVPLREVLLAAGVGPEARHAAFTGLDEIEMKDQRFGFGGSGPIALAMGPELVLAYEMNGEPLAPEHGAPLRVVAPGYIGARSVKWLASIELQEEPSSNYYQTHAYKIFPSQVNEETADWRKGLMLGELSVNSVICQPTDEETVPAGPISVRGYAITGGERSVERVRRIRGRREDLDDSRSARRERALGLAILGSLGRSQTRPIRDCRQGLGRGGQHPAGARRAGMELQGLHGQLLAQGKGVLQRLTPFWRRTSGAHSSAPHPGLRASQVRTCDYPTSMRSLTWAGSIHYVLQGPRWRSQQVKGAYVTPAFGGALAADRSRLFGED